MPNQSWREAVLLSLHPRTGLIGSGPGSVGVLNHKSVQLQKSLRLSLLIEPQPECFPQQTMFCSQQATTMIP